MHRIRIIRRSLFAVTAAAVIAGAAGPRIAGQGFDFTPQRRDTSAAPTTGTAAISGRLVTDDATPQPVRRARVVAQGVESEVNKWVMTDAAGRFSITELPEGRYTVSATKAGFVRAVFGSKRFDRPGTPVGLANGQRVEASMRMLRGAVITGTVRDENGQPAPGVNVRAMQFRVQNGERTLVNASSGAGFQGDTTDDRGIYRIFGLSPGEFVVSATPRDNGRGNLKQMTDGQLRTAQQALKPGVAPIGAQTSQPAQEQAEAPTVGFTPMYYPGAMLPTDGTVITLGIGEERDNVDVQLRLVRTARVSGKVISPDNVSPQDVQLMLTPAGANGISVTGSISINTAPVAADGTFSFNGVAPGAYTLSARAASRPPGQQGGQGANAQLPQSMGPIRVLGAGGALNLWANADVSVDGQNLGGITLSLQEGMRFAGRLAFEGSRPTPTDDLKRARIQMVPNALGGTMIMMGGGSGQVDESGRFALTGVTPGKYRVLATLSSPEANWTLKSAVAKGRDVLDFPLEIAPNEDIMNAVLTFTDLSQTVSGSLQDATGRPAPDYTIVVFPADKALWTATRRIRTARPGTDGTFRFTGLPAGSYRIAALVDMAPNDTSEPSFFEELVPASIAFTLKDGQTHVQDLRIGK